MVTVLKVLVVASLMATLGVMLAGMAGLVRSEQRGGTRSNLLMRWRVGLQFLTIILFMLLLLATRG